MVSAKVFAPMLALKVQLVSKAHSGCPVRCARALSCAKVDKSVPRRRHVDLRLAQVFALLICTLDLELRNPYPHSEKMFALLIFRCRGTSHIRNTPLVEPYRSPMPGDLW